MNVDGTPYRTIWPAPDGRAAEIIDQTRLPFEIAGPGTDAANPAFDVTSARLVTGLITERGVAPATHEGLARLYPERAR